MEKKFNFVYATTNLINGKQYIGDHSTNNLNDNYLGSGKATELAIKKYGKKNFKREILEQFETKQEAFDAQAKWINEYNTLSPNGYNLSPKGGSQCNGGISEETKQKMRNKILSEETKQKMRIAQQNRSDEWKENIKLHHVGFTGKHCSLEHKDKLSNAMKGKTEGEKNGMWGKSLSEESKIKWKKTREQSQYKPSEETKEKIRIGNQNKIVSEDTKKKLSEAAKNRKWSEEWKQKQSDRVKAYWAKQKMLKNC